MDNYSIKLLQFVMKRCQYGQMEIDLNHEIVSHSKILNYWKLNIILGKKMRSRNPKRDAFKR